MATAAQGIDAAPADASAAAESGVKKKGSKTVLFTVLAVVLLGAGGAAAWFLGLLPIGTGAGASAGAAAAGGEHASAAAEAPPKQGGHGALPGASAIRPLDPFLANLADDGGTRYLKATIQVEFVATEPPATFEGRMVQIRDAILTLLGSKTFADIRTPRGKEALRDDLVDRLNHILQTEAVKAVYFTEFIVQ